MTMKLQVLKPGLLVSLSTRVVGGVSYHRHEVEADHTTESGERRAMWETTRVIPEPEEFEAAVKARSAARSTIVAACCQSSFGLLCPSANEAELAEAVVVARKVAELHNAQAKLTRVEVFILVGRVAHDEVEAQRAIGAELRELLDAMRAGIAAADPEAIREAATKARNLGGMLSEEAAGKVSEAITEARKAARALVQRVEKAGENAAVVVAELSVKQIEGARFAFLDLGDSGAVEAEAPAGRSVELPAESAPAAAPAAPVPAPRFELGA